MPDIPEDPREEIASNATPEEGEQEDQHEDEDEDENDSTKRSSSEAKGKGKAQPEPVESAGEASSITGIRGSTESRPDSHGARDEDTSSSEDNETEGRQGLLNMLMGCLLCGPRNVKSMFDVGPDPYADSRSRGQEDDSDRRFSHHRSRSPATPPSIVAPHLNKTKQSPSPPKSPILLTPHGSPNKMREPERGALRPRRSADMHAQEYLEEQRLEALQRGIIRQFRTNDLPHSPKLVGSGKREVRLLSIADEISQGQAPKRSLFMDSLLRLPVDKREPILDHCEKSSVTLSSPREVVSLDPPIEHRTSLTLPDPVLLLKDDLFGYDLTSHHLFDPLQTTATREHAMSSKDIEWLWQLAPSVATSAAAKSCVLPTPYVAVGTYNNYIVFVADTPMSASNPFNEPNGSRHVQSISSGSSFAPFQLPPAPESPSDSESDAETSSELELESSEPVGGPSDPLIVFGQGHEMFSTPVGTSAPGQAEGSNPHILNKPGSVSRPQAEPSGQTQAGPPQQASLQAPGSPRTEARAEPQRTLQSQHLNARFTLRQCLILRFPPYGCVNLRQIASPILSPDETMPGTLLGPPIMSRPSQRRDWSSTLEPTELSRANMRALNRRAGLLIFPRIAAWRYQVDLQQHAHLSTVRPHGPMLYTPPHEGSGTSTSSGQEDATSSKPLNIRARTQSSSGLARQSCKVVRKPPNTEGSSEELPRTSEAVPSRAESGPTGDGLGWEQLSTLASLQEPMAYGAEVAQLFEQDIKQISAWQASREWDQQVQVPRSTLLSFSEAGQQLFQSSAVDKHSASHPTVEFPALLNRQRRGPVDPGRANSPLAPLGQCPAISERVTTIPPHMEVIAPIPHYPPSARHGDSSQSTTTWPLTRILSNSTSSAASPMVQGPSPGTSFPNSPRIFPPGFGYLGRRLKKQFAPFSHQKPCSGRVDTSNMSERDRMLLYREGTEERRGEPCVLPRFRPTPGCPEMSSGPSFASTPVLPTLGGSTGGHTTPMSRIVTPAESGSEGYASPGEVGGPSSGRIGMERNVSGRGQKRGRQNTDHGSSHGSTRKSKDVQEEEERQKYARER
ncbi:hypothetical protein IAU59_001949 [Kwoniella sp. CBS 9459]